MDCSMTRRPAVNFRRARRLAAGSAFDSCDSKGLSTIFILASPALLTLSSDVLGNPTRHYAALGASALYRLKHSR
jgi:hypothetical protein